MKQQIIRWYSKVLLVLLVIVSGWGLMACPEVPKSLEEPVLESYDAMMLSPEQHLLRISMALRGTRPSLEEFKRLQGRPAVISGLVDEYMRSKAFGEMLRAVHARWLLTNVSPDYYPAAFPAIGPLAGKEVHQINLDLIAAAPRLVEHVVMNARPYSEILTAGYTLANETVAAVWGIAYDKSKGGWQKTRYKDKRPMAGILSDGFLFTRHASTSANRNRGRAQQIARIFLCVDYTNREVDLKNSLDLSDERKVRLAVRENESCNSCHQTLDPLASFFSSHYPLRLPSQEVSYPLKQYSPEFNGFFRTSKPIFFGRHGKDIRDLGRMIAKDPRFVTCMVRRFYAELMDIPIARVPRDRADRYARLFREAKMDVRVLLKNIVLSDDFRAMRVKKESASQVAQSTVGFRRAKPHQIDAMFNELTGFRWHTDINYYYGGRIGRVNLTTDSFFGYKLQGGGADGYDVWFPKQTATPTTVLLLRGIAQRASPKLVQSDLSKPSSERRLLHLVTKTTRDEATIRRQLASLHLRLFGDVVASDAATISAGWSLFQSVAQQSNSATRAWEIVLFAMLQDIRMLYY